MRLKKRMAILSAGVIALAGGGVVIAAISDAAGPRPAPAHVTNANLTSVVPTTPTPEPTTAGDTDHVQSGDQSGTDKTAGAEAPGDTHADAPGQDVSHECPPACDTANGETP